MGVPTLSTCSHLRPTLPTGTWTPGPCQRQGRIGRSEGRVALVWIFPPNRPWTEDAGTSSLPGGDPRAQARHPPACLGAVGGRRSRCLSTNNHPSFEGPAQPTWGTGHTSLLGPGMWGFTAVPPSSGTRFPIHRRPEERTRSHLQTPAGCSAHVRPVNSLLPSPPPWRLWPAARPGPHHVPRPRGEGGRGRKQQRHRRET